MKKILIALAIVALVASASYAQVYSRNAVGYITHQLSATPKLSLVTDPFFVVGGTERNLTDVFNKASGLASGAAPTTADAIYVWDSSAQKYITLGIKTSDGLLYLKNSWAAGVTNRPIRAGESFFVQRAGATITNFYVMGEVPSALTRNVQVAGSAGSTPLSFVANPYPVTQTMDSLVNTNNGAIAAASPAACDTVYLWNEGTQTYAAYGLRNSSPPNWRLKTAWTTPATNLVPVGKGFLYQRASTGAAFSYAVDRPYTWPNY